MYESIVARKEQWDAFLRRWPIDKLREMSLEEYTHAGDHDCFVYWLEAKTDSLGSIWGGSAFKFGIYSRKDETEKNANGNLCYAADYGWYCKYGDTPQSAFAKIKENIALVAEGARAGDLVIVDRIDLGQVYKWKLAFLYQDKNNPSVLPILKTEYLQAALNSAEKTVSALQAELMKGALGKDLLEYADEVWARVQSKISTELTTEEAKDFLDQSDDFSPIKPATQKMAGYATKQDQQLALALENKSPTIYVSAGDWIVPIVHLFKEVEHYPASRLRRAGLAANAPKLDVGNDMVKVVVPTMSTLIALCEAYEGSHTPAPKSGPNVMTDRDKPAAPLNQILYGPPGTGKTYATVDAALEILAPDLLNSYQEDRAVLKAQFDSLVAAGHIRFVTFHQSFSYEDFVEGLRADKGDDGQLRYDVADGVFKSLCEAAAVKITKQAEVPIDLDLTKGRVWKMSLGDSLGSDSYIFDECIKHGYALLGWGKMVDFSGCHTKEEIHKRLLDSGHQVAEDTYMVRAVNTFVLKMKVGDLIVVSEGNTKFRAVGQITGNYRYIQRGELDDGYGQCRDVQWLRVYKPSLPSDQLMNNRFSQMTLYELHSDSIDMEKLMGLLHAQTPLNSALATRSPFHPGEAFGSGYKVVKASNEILELEKPNGSELAFSMRLLGVLANHVNNGQLSLDDIREKRVFDKLPDSKLERYIVNGYNNVLPSLVERLIGRNDPSILHLNTEPAPTAKVLIIDEINRGNVSRIFGELITLIEPSKRAGEPEALEVTLPYSKKRFSIPNNLYLIGTMNTADRSLAGLDIALRRRFDFREFPPKPELLDDTTVSGVNVGQMLRIINERIELLLDRDHCLGHAYFMSLKENPTIDELRNIFRLKIIPLLEEYFFEDWQRIQWVLNDHRKAYSYQFIRKPITNTEALFGDKVSANDHALRWEINETAFTNPDAYAEIVNASAIGDK